MSKMIFSCRCPITPCNAQQAIGHVIGCGSLSVDPVTAPHLLGIRGGRFHRASSPYFPVYHRQSGVPKLYSIRAYENLHLPYTQWSNLPNTQLSTPTSISTPQQKSSSSHGASLPIPSTRKNPSKNTKLQPALLLLSKALYSSKQIVNMI